MLHSDHRQASGRKATPHSSDDNTNNNQTEHRRGAGATHRDVGLKRTPRLDPSEANGIFILSLIVFSVYSSQRQLVFFLLVFSISSLTLAP